MCPPCSLTDMGAELKKPNVSLQSNDQARLCSPRKEGNLKAVGERGREVVGGRGANKETQGGEERKRKTVKEERGRREKHVTELRRES